MKPLARIVGYRISPFETRAGIISWPSCGFETIRSRSGMERLQVRRDKVGSRKIRVEKCFHHSPAGDPESIRLAKLMERELKN